MNHKTDMQAVLLDAMRVISESADEIKAGCAIDDEWPDAEDKAEYDRRVSVLERVRALVGKSAGVPEGWKIIRVNDHFDALIASLERAEGKGYLPDAIAKEWENFACAENVAVPAAPAPVSAPSPDREHEVPCAKLVGRWDYGKPGCVRYEPDFPRGDIPEGTPVYVGSAPSPDREQAPYSAPFTTDVPNCCGDPETCNDPCDASPSRECEERPAALSEEQREAIETSVRVMKDAGFARTVLGLESILAASAPTLGGGNEVVSPAELRSHARTIRMKEDNQGSIDRDCAEAATALEYAALVIEGLEYRLAQPQAAEPKGLTEEERDAIEWAAGEAYSWAKSAINRTLMFKRWNTLCALLSKGE